MSRTPLEMLARIGGFRSGESRHLACGALAVVTLLGAVLRVSYVDAPIRWDEALVFYWVENWHPLSIAVNYYNVGNHILHTFAMLASHTLFGAEPWSVRLPSLLAGIALIPVTFLAASSLVPRSVALMAAGLVAGSPYLVLYSINSRGYMLQCVLVLLLLWLLMRLVETPSRRLTVATGAVGGLALYTLPTTIFLLPGLYLGVALRGARDGEPRALRVVIGTLAGALLITGGLGLFLYLPVFVMSWFRHPLDTIVSQSPAPADLWEYFGRAVRETAQRWTWDLPAPGRILCAVVATIGVFGLARRRTGAATVVLLAIAGTAATSLVMQRVPQTRGYLFLMPFFLVLLASGIQTIMEWRPFRAATCYPLVAVLLAAGGMTWTWSSRWIDTAETGHIAGAEAAMETLARTVGPRDRVGPQFPQLRYYVRLHDLPIRFVDYDLNLDGVDRLYVAVRPHVETVDETLDRRLGRTTGALDAFGEPELVAVFPELRIFVVSRRTHSTPMRKP